MCSSIKNKASDLYPKVSVIIPSFNTGKFIINAITSAINTDYPNLEIVVVDDGSSDDSVHIITDLINRNHDVDIKLYHHPGMKNKGIANTRNLGIRKAKGEYISFLDADDMFLKNRFECCIKLLEKDETIDAVLEAYEYFFVSGKRADIMKTGVMDETGKQNVKVWSHGLSDEGDTLMKALMGKLPVHTTSITIRKEVFNFTGMFPDLKYCLEPPLWFKIISRGRTVYGNCNPVSRYFIHESSHIAKNDKLADFAFDTIRSLMNAYVWMKRNKIQHKYIQAFKKRITGKWYTYCSYVLKKEHSFIKDVLINMIKVGIVVPSLLLKVKFWKVFIRLICIKSGLVKE